MINYNSYRICYRSVSVKKFDTYNLIIIYNFGSKLTESFVKSFMKNVYQSWEIPLIPCSQSSAPLSKFLVIIAIGENAWPSTIHISLVLIFFESYVPLILLILVYETVLMLTIRDKIKLKYGCNEFTLKVAYFLKNHERVSSSM